MSDMQMVPCGPLMNNLVINQPFGLGDIIFLQGLVEKLRQNNNIIFPVADEYYWIQDYLGRENVQFPRRSQYPINYEDASMREDYLPLRFSTQVLRGLAPHDYSHDHTVMEDKYTLMKEDCSIWRDFPIKRNLEKEHQLIADLGLDEEGYTFINEMYGSEAVGSGSIKIPKKGKTVTLFRKNGYTLFDWLGVLEKCSSYHTVDTSVVWLIDYLNPKGDKVIYSRGKNTQALQGVISTDWRFV